MPPSRVFRWLFVGLLTLNLSACPAPPTTPPTDTPPTFDAGCHPFAQGHCFLPFPSSFFLKADPTSSTGYRVAYTDKLPVAADSKQPIKKEYFDTQEGFSPATPILVLFKERVDPSTILSSAQIAKSTEATSPIQIIEFGSRRRIPLMSEVDASAEEGEAQTLIIRPMIRLKAKTRYAVVLLKTLKASGGKALSVPETYTYLAAGKSAGSSPLAAMEKPFKETLEEVTASGLKKEDLLLTWDFFTASDLPHFERLKSMRDQALADIEGKPIGYTFTSVQENPPRYPELLKALEGTFEVPSFLDNDPPGGRILLDGAGKPKLRGKGSFALQIHVPKCAETKGGPLPILLFGHGLFGSAKSEMTSEYHRKLSERLCMVEIGTNWIGMSTEDVSELALPITQDFAFIRPLTERLQQAQVNFLTLTRLAMKDLVKAPELQREGKPLLDPSQIYYLGISNGAIQGGTFMTLTEDIERGVLNVGAGNWNFMISRSSNFAVFLITLKLNYPSPVDRQFVIGLLQAFFDSVDPLTFLSTYPDPSFFGPKRKKILYQESIGDAQVPNLATRLLIRTMQIPALKPLIEPPFGVEEKDGPLDMAAYIQIDTKASPLPQDKNLPAAGNGAHGDARLKDSVIKQMEAFFKPNGKIVQTCEGPCDPN